MTPGVSQPTRAGRRPGPTLSKAAILTAARQEFADRGFDGATVRRIAARAGVDPAMINHHFGSKHRLFLAALQTSVDPRARIAQVIAGPVGMRGEQLIRLLLEIWDSPTGTAATAMLRTALQDEVTRDSVREFVLDQIVRPLVEGVTPALTGAAERERRAALLVSQLLGLIFARYVFELPALVEAAHNQIAADIGPSVQRYLSS